MLFHRLAAKPAGVTLIGGTSILLLAVICHCVVGQELRLEALIPQPVMLLGFDFSADGNYFAVGGNYGVWVYETETGTLIRRLAIPGFVRAIAFSPDKHDQFATGSDDGAIRIWRIGQREPLQRIEIGRGFLGELVFFPDGESLVSSGTSLPGGEPRKPSALVAIVNIQTGKIDKEFRDENELLCPVAISHGGQLLAIGKRHTKSVSVYDRNTWEVKHTVSIPDGVPNSINFLNEQDDIVVTGGKFFGKNARPQRDGRIWLCKKSGDKYESSLLTQGGSESFRRGSTSPDGKNVAVGTMEVRMYFNSRGQQTRTQLVTLLQLRSTKNGEVEWTADGKLGDPYGVTFFPDGRLVAMCSSDSVFLFATKSGKLVQEIVPPW